MTARKQPPVAARRICESFVTGATGFVGSPIVPELISAGHRVLGLARLDSAAASLTAASADVQRGSLEDLASLRSGAGVADAVINAGFIHDFANYAWAAETDRLAIQTIGAVLAGFDRPFIVTSGTALAAPGHLRCTRLAAARLYRLVLEKSPMAPRYHAVADEGVPFREIAQVIGRRLNIPVVSKSPKEASDHFGRFAHFAGLDSPASSARTREQLEWHPTQPPLIPDMDQPSYFEANQRTFDQKIGASK